MIRKKAAAFFTALAMLFCVLSVNVSADGDNYKTWLQTDSRWGSIGFGYNDSYTVARVGCALTSVAKVMAYSGAVSRDTSVFNPGVLCTFLKANGGFTSSGDIYWAKPCEYTSNFTLEKWTNVSGTKDEKISQIKSFLDSGCMVVCSVKYYGHYVAVEKVENGKVFIMDPASNNITDLFYYDEAGVGANVIVYKGPKGVNDGGNNSGNLGEEYVTGRYRVKSSDGLNVRSGPSSDYQKVGWLADKAEVDVTDIYGEWGKIEADGVSGWICLKYAEKIEDPFYTLYMELVSPSNKTVYKEGEDFDPSGITVKLHYSNGTSETVTSGFDVSGYSSTPGTHVITVSMWGFYMTFEVTVTSKTAVYPVGSYRITSQNGVNVRAVPSTEGEIIGGLGFNDKIRAYEVAGEWGKIDFNGKVGYVNLRYAECLSALTARGDADGNGIVNVSDALVILQYSVGTLSVNDIDIAGADADLNGVINVVDAIVTLQLSLGNI